MSDRSDSCTLWPDIWLSRVYSLTSSFLYLAVTRVEFGHVLAVSGMSRVNTTVWHTEVWHHPCLSACPVCTVWPHAYDAWLSCVYNLTSCLWCLAVLCVQFDLMLMTPGCPVCTVWSHAYDAWLSCVYSLTSCPDVYTRVLPLAYDAWLSCVYSLTVHSWRLVVLCVHCSLTSCLWCLAVLCVQFDLMLMMPGCPVCTVWPNAYDAWLSCVYSLT